MTSRFLRIFSSRVLSPRGNVSAYRCVGVSAFAKHHQLRRDLLIRTLESTLYFAALPCMIFRKIGAFSFS